MNKKFAYIIILIILITGITIGYSLLSENLNINGFSSINHAIWDIHFENVQVDAGSVESNEPTLDSKRTTVTYSVTLNGPGDYYEFTIDAKNDGSIDAMIDSVSSTLNNENITNLPNYLNYSVTYSDDSSILPKHELNSGEKATYKVRVEYKKDIDAGDLPNTQQTLNFKFGITYIQKDETSIARPHPESFETDSWETIIDAIRNDNTDVYEVGDEKEIFLVGYGSFNLRIANKSTPVECNQAGFSQTACGFVIEFADIVTSLRVNPFTVGDYSAGNGNVGGWESSDIRAFLNGSLYNFENINYSANGLIDAFPSELKNAIISTTVVSGHGNADSQNFTTTDKLYLLSTREIWIDDDGDSRAGPDRYDTAYNSTRQLDYYSSYGTALSNYSAAIKRYQGNAYEWWLRSPSSSNYRVFYTVRDSGNWFASLVSNSPLGISPAFRLG